MKQARRRILGIVAALVLVLLACVAGAWRQAWRQLAELEALAAATAHAPEPRSSEAWASQESFTYDLQPPRNEPDEFGQLLAAATG